MITQEIPNVLISNGFSCACFFGRTRNSGYLVSGVRGSRRAADGPPARQKPRPPDRTNEI